jgi:hypothetical protein
MSTTFNSRPQTPRFDNIKNITYAKIKDAVLEASVQADLAELSILLLKVSLGTRGISQVEGKTTLGFAGHEQLSDGNLGILDSASSDGLLGQSNGSLQQHDGLCGNSLSKLDHLLADGLLVDNNESLDGAAVLTKNEEAHVAS